MGSIRQILQAQSKNIKKLSKHQIYHSGRTFFQKKYVENVRKKRSQKFV
jgi:hypothetical protein